MDIQSETSMFFFKKAFICLHGVKIISLYTEASQNICFLCSLLTHKEILLSVYCIKILTLKLYMWNKFSFKLKIAFYWVFEMSFLNFYFYIYNYTIIHFLALEGKYIQMSDNYKKSLKHLLTLNCHHT